MSVDRSTAVKEPLTRCQKEFFIFSTCKKCRFQTIFDFTLTFKQTLLLRNENKMGVVNKSFNSPFRNNHLDGSKRKILENEHRTLCQIVYS